MILHLIMYNSTLRFAFGGARNHSIHGSCSHTAATHNDLTWIEAARNQQQQRKAMAMANGK